MNPECWFTYREVSARRALRLRKRGEDVHYACRTRTGKARYEWFVGITLRRADQPT